MATRMVKIEGSIKPPKLPTKRELDAERAKYEKKKKAKKK